MAEPTDPWNTPAFLRDVQYRTDANLAARQSIYVYQHPRLDLQARVIDLAAPAPGATVADVGCGNGAYLAELASRGFAGRVLGLDMSLGMLAAARDRLTRSARRSGSAGSAARPTRLRRRNTPAPPPSSPGGVALIARRRDRAAAARRRRRPDAGDAHAVPRARPVAGGPRAAPGHPPRRPGGDRPQRARPPARAARDRRRRPRRRPLRSPRAGDPGRRRGGPASG